MGGNWVRFDVIVADRQMSRLDGFGLVARLREAVFPGRIIVYSGTLTEEIMARYRDLAVDAMVVKGPDSARLLAVVQALNEQS